MMTLVVCHSTVMMCVAWSTTYCTVTAIRCLSSTSMSTHPVRDCSHQCNDDGLSTPGLLTIYAETVASNNTNTLC